MLRLFNNLWSNLIGKVFLFEMVSNTSTAGDVDKIMSWEVLIAAALDEDYNHKLQESHWYGLWDDVLQYFRQGSVVHCFVYPQYTLYKLVDEDDIGSDYDPRSDASGRGSSFDLEDIGLQEILIENTQTDAITPPSTPFESPYPDDPLKEGALNTSTPRSPQSLIIPSPGRVVLGQRKVPDFGIGCYLNCSRIKGINARYESRPNIAFERRFIPILVEIKSYAWVERNHNHQRSKNILTERITEACTDLLTQTTFFFSPRSKERKQSAVLAIAASGMVWCWIQWKNVNGRPTPNMEDNSSVKSDHDYSTPTSWSKRYEIGTKSSALMLRRIREWMEDLALKPGPLVNNPPVIKEV